VVSLKKGYQEALSVCLLCRVIIGQNLSSHMNSHDHIIQVIVSIWVQANISDALSIYLLNDIVDW